MTLGNPGTSELKREGIEDPAQELLNDGLRAGCVEELDEVIETAGFCFLVLCWSVCESISGLILSERWCSSP